MPSLLDLTNLNFGSGAADHEDSLANFFYKTQAFDRGCGTDVCLVLGEKGAGKSAIFLMMREMAQDIPQLKNPNFFVATTANLREHFHLLSSKLSSPVSHVTLWKFYFASIAALSLLDTSQGDDAKFLLNFVEHWELNPQNFPSLLGATLKLPLKYASLELKRTSAITVNPLQLHEVFSVVNRILSTDSRILWIAIDELDKISLNGGDAKNHTSDLLNDLMQTHSELYQFNKIRFKFFIRSDIYEELTYVDKDHFTNAILRLGWEPEDLAIMLALRILASTGMVGTSPTLERAYELINQVFEWPASIPTFGKLLDELRDGRGSVTPRDLLNFAINSKWNQVRFNTYGINKPAKGIISSVAVEKGLEEASKTKLSDFLTTFPELYRRYMNLHGHAAATISQVDLQRLLNLPDKLNFDLAMEDFCRIGAIAKQGSKPVHLTDEFIIPPIYRRSLDLGGPER